MKLEAKKGQAWPLSSVAEFDGYFFLVAAAFVVFGAGAGFFAGLVSFLMWWLTLIPP